MPKWHNYTLSYNYSKEWESDPTLKTWITPVVGDESTVLNNLIEIGLETVDPI